METVDRHDPIMQQRLNCREQASLIDRLVSIDAIEKSSPSTESSMDRTRRSGPGGPCGIEGLNHSLGVLVEGLHIGRQNLSTVRVAEQLSVGKS